MRMLVLAEKPSVARQIASIVKRAKLPDDIDVDSFHGHLMKLPDPDYYDPALKQWSLDSLPIIPDNFVYVEDDKKSCARLMQKIKAGKYDYLVNACDAGREGDLIFYSFYWGHNLKIPVLRFWTSSSTDKAMEAALGNLMPASNFNGYTQSAVYRARFDWLLGMNMSRAVTLKTGTQVNVGSVMTPTLAMIVNRELTIRNFKPEPFYEVQSTFLTSKGEAYQGTYLVPPDHKKTRLDKKSDAETVVKRLTPGVTGKIIDVQTKRVSTKAPTLYSLLELQKDGSKYFGYKANRTLEIAQALYETHKLITYPRSESRFLPTDLVPEIMDHIKPLYNIPELAQYAKNLAPAHIKKVLSTKDYVDDAKLTDHHAIIPTDEKPVLTNLSKDERNIYILVCKRFLSIFMDPYVVDKTVMITDVGGDWYKSSGKIEIEKGFGKLYAASGKDVILPNVTKGDDVSVKSGKLLEKETTPPNRYTTETILDAMQNAGNQLSDAALRKVMRESAGLGTSATRAAILEKLEKLGMVQVKKSTYYPTDFGIDVIDALKGKDVCSPELRAKWEQDFKTMEDTNKVEPNFQDKINAYIVHETEQVVKTLNYDLTKYRAGMVGKCPKCGKPVLKVKSFFLCQDYKKSCDFFIPPDVMGATLTDDDAKDLLEGNVTDDKHLTTKAGKTLVCGLVLDEFKVKPAFAVATTNQASGPMKKSNKIVGKCPACGGDMYETGRFFTCANRSTGCQFVISKSILGATVTAADAKALLSGKSSSKKTFQWKNGKSGTAKLRLNGTKLDFEF